MPPASRHTYTTAELANADLTNLAAALDAFIAAASPSILGLLQAETTTERAKARLPAALAFLRETVTEHVWSEFREAYAAHGEWFEADPMKEAA